MIFGDLEKDRKAQRALQESSDFGQHINSASDEEEKKKIRDEFLARMLHKAKEDAEYVAAVLANAVYDGYISDRDIPKPFFGILSGGGYGYGLASYNIDARFPTGNLDGNSGPYTSAEFNPDQHKTLGDYIAANALKYENYGEMGGDNRGPYVEMLLNRAGVAAGNPWCAAHTSNNFVGLGLFVPTARAIGFVEQALATDSFRARTMQGIEIGDVIVSSREEGNHSGTVVKVRRDDAGNVLSIVTAEGNTGRNVRHEGQLMTDVVTLREYSATELKSNYRGFVDISHREAKLLEMGVLKEPVIATLSRKHSEKHQEPNEAITQVPTELKGAIEQFQANKQTSPDSLAAKAIPIPKPVEAAVGEAKAAAPALL